MDYEQANRGRVSCVFDRRDYRPSGENHYLSILIGSSLIGVSLSRLRDYMTIRWLKVEHVARQAYEQHILSRLQA